MNKSGTTLIKEIAEHLGVSPGTVSIVLNGRGDNMRISKATQQRVKDAAREMNYQPNIYARRLRSAGMEIASKVIAIFWSTDFTDDTMGRFFKGIQLAVKEKDYKVEFFIQLFDFDHLSDCKNIMTSSRFSGIIVSGVSDADAEFLNANRFDLPILLMNRNEQRYHCVYVNDYEIGKSCGRLFFTRNHKHAGLISMKRKGYGAGLRQLGFLEACSKYQIEVKSEWFQEGEGRDFISGYEATKRLLQCKDKPTAIFVMSAGQVLGTVQACKDAGISIPGDIEVLTYGDSDVFEYFSPSISSVHIPMETMAENALNLLILVIENGIEMPMSRMLFAGHAFRESCGGFPEGDAENDSII
jgi:Transcriptional regulators